MAAQQEIGAAAEAFTISYINALLPPSYQTTISKRAANMASHYLPNVVFLVAGSTSQVSNPTPAFPAQDQIAAILEKLDADRIPIEAKEHRVEVVGKNSAICWMTFRRKRVEWTNVYFFRMMDGEKVGFEGWIFDGEAEIMKELAKE